jgi:hypothetical protein
MTLPSELWLKTGGNSFKIVISFLQVTKCGVVEAVLSWARFKAAKDLQKQCSGKKQNKLKGCVLKLLLLEVSFCSFCSYCVMKYG